MTFRAALSILLTTGAVWAASGPACDHKTDSLAPDGVPDELIKTPEILAAPLEVGTKQTMRVQIKADGQPVANTKVVWSVSQNGGSLSSDTTLTDASGNTSVEWTMPQAPTGSASLFVKVAANENLRVSWSTTVKAGALTKVAATPDTVRVDVNATSKLVAATLDRFNNAVTGTVSWQTLDAGIATVAADGTVTGKTAGTTRIIATSGGVSDTSIVIVKGVVTGIVLNTHALQMNVGQTARLIAVVLGDPGATVTWSTTANAIASVDATGLVTAAAAGSARIIATAGTKADTAVITVAPVPQTTVNVNPQNSMFIKREAAGTTISGAGIYAGDHEENGDKTIQGFVSYSMANVPAAATIASAKVTVLADVANIAGNPFSLGPLLVEWASAPALNEGTPSGAVQVMTTAQTQGVTVDVTSIVQAARTNGATNVWLRFRFQNLVNNNGATDYVPLTTSPMEIKY